VLTVVETVYPEGQLALQLMFVPWAWRYHPDPDRVIASKKPPARGGEEAFRNCVVQSSAFGRHAWGDFVDLQHLPAGINPIPAALIGMEQEFVGSFSATPLEWVPLPGEA
jgi:hypothetical protein